MNFNVVEGSYTDLEEIYPDFKDDFLHSDLYVNDLRVKYGLTHKEYKEIAEKVKMECHLSRRPRRWGTMDFKYYYKHDYGFVIRKRLDNIDVYIGFVPYEWVARKVVELCIKAGWNVDVCRNICKTWRSHLV